MQSTIEAPRERAVTASAKRSLADRLRARIAIEEEFARIGGKVKTKSLFRRHEKRLVAPAIKAGLQLLGLYDRGRQHALSPVVLEYDLYFPDLPAAFDGFRIMHLTDLHIDGVDGLTEIVISTLQKLEADLCLITGDYRFDDEGPWDEVYRRVRQLLPYIAARQGIYSILGNHDESPVAFELEELGVRMLINEAVEIGQGSESIWIAGVDDPFDYKCDDLPGALAGVPDSGFKILLAHTPDLYSEAAAFGVRIYLCGHTHGGQVRFPKIGALRSNSKSPRAFTYRRWTHQRMEGYTGGGLGCSSLPVRWNCPPEIAVFTLHRSGA